MRIPFLSLLVVIPGLLSLWIITRFFKEQTKEGKTRWWVLLLLMVACCMLVVVSLGAEGFVDGDIAIPVLFVLPALNGALALIVIEWRNILGVWKGDKVLVSVLLAALLILLLSTGRFLSARTYMVFVPGLLVAGFWLLAGAVGFKGLEITGVLMGGFLLLEAFGLLSHPLIVSSPELKSAYTVILGVIKLLALVLLAGLLYQGWEEDLAGRDRRSWVWIGVMAFLLFSIGAVEFRYGVLVEATGRAAEDHAPYLGVMMGIVAGMVLAFAGVLRGRGSKIGLLYMFLVPFFLIVSFAAGSLIDPHAITAKRADRIQQAVESYQSNTGMYPGSISQLSPDYMPVILGPLSGRRGQVWCYQGGADYYRLGYVFIERYHAETFPHPFTEVRIFAQTGQPPGDEWICNQELEKNQLSLGL